MKLADIRVERGHTINSLAKAAGVGSATISRTEWGFTTPAYATVMKLARALDADPHEVDEFRPVVEEFERATA
jgi:transcriptional regulator with XRE-family HTH domain